MDNETYTNLAVHLQEVDSRSKHNEQRIEELEDDMKTLQETQITLVKLANGIDNMTKQLGGMNDDIKDVKKGQAVLNQKVTELENKPAQSTYKRITNIWDKIIWVVAGGIFAAILSYLIPGIPW